MKSNTAKNLLKGVGGVLAVCSAVTMMATSKSDGMETKKTMKKTANKVADFVDAVVSLM